MKLVYTGNHAEVEVPDAGIVAQRDVPIDVPDKVAKELLKQDSWAEDKPSPAPKKAGNS